MKNWICKHNTISSFIIGTGIISLFIGGAALFCYLIILIPEKYLIVIFYGCCILVGSSILLYLVYVVGAETVEEICGPKVTRRLITRGDHQGRNRNHRQKRSESKVAHFEAPE